MYNSGLLIRVLSYNLLIDNEMKKIKCGYWTRYLPTAIADVSYLNQCTNIRVIIFYHVYSSKEWVSFNSFYSVNKISNCYTMEYKGQENLSLIILLSSFLSSWQSTCIEVLNISGKQTAGMTSKQSRIYKTWSWCSNFKQSNKRNLQCAMCKVDIVILILSSGSSLYHLI